MISVPNVRIHLREMAPSNRASSHDRPRWFADMYKSIWGSRLDPENGLVIEELPDDYPESLRYSTFTDMSGAQAATVNYFLAGADDRKLRADLIIKFKTLFPDGLDKLIKAEVEADLRRAHRYIASEKSKMVPHQSFKDANISGLTDEQILRIQSAGYANLIECADAKAMVLWEKCGLTAVQSANLLSAAQVVRSVASTASQATKSSEAKK
jgi:hypothetical protein